MNFDLTNRFIYQSRLASMQEYETKPHYTCSIEPNYETQIVQPSIRVILPEGRMYEIIEELNSYLQKQPTQLFAQPDINMIAMFFKNENENNLRAIRQVLEKNEIPDQTRAAVREQFPTLG